jgi:G3E family GTPase
VPASDNPVPTYLVCGFLGAGKTTFILDHLRHAGRRTAVLVNEFGSLGIDGEVIRTFGKVDVIEMPGGCICCSQREGLEARVREIVHSIHPDLLLIEPSGVAETSGLIEALTASLKGSVSLDAVITIADAATFLEYCEPDSFGTFFFDQIENADMIIINKRDAVDSTTLTAIEEKAAGLNRDAVIVTTEYCRIEAVIPSGRLKDRVIANKKDICFSTASVSPQGSITREWLDRFIAEMTSGRFGNVLRAKGFLHVGNEGCFNLQFTPRQTSLTRFSHEVDSRLVLIGCGIKRAEFIRYFEDMAR